VEWNKKTPDRVGEISFPTHQPAIVDEEKSTDLNVTAVEKKPVKPRGFFARIRYYEELMDRKMGIESHSLDRVLPEARNPPNPLVMAFMWASATMNISCFSTGFLGYEFGLSLGDSIPIIIFATLLGACVTVSMPSPFATSLETLLFLFAFRVGARQWAPARDCARSPFPDTLLASTHRQSSRR
jgi:hypothetical protein